MGKVKDEPKPTAVDAWLNDKPPTVRYVMFELKSPGLIRAHAASDDSNEDGPTAFGRTHAEALEELEKLLGKETFS